MKYFFIAGICFFISWAFAYQTASTPEGFLEVWYFLASMATGITGIFSFVAYFENK